MLPRVGKEWPAIHVHAAAIYARESDPHRQDSIPQQLEAGRRYAARIGIPVLYELQDGMSGLSAKRRDYQRLIQLAQDGRISHIILFEAKRFGRDDTEFVSQARKLLRLGVEFHDEHAPAQAQHGHTPAALAVAVRPSRAVHALGSERTDEPPTASHLVCDPLSPAASP